MKNNLIIGKRSETIKHKNFIDLSGQSFGRLLVLDVAGKDIDNERWYWLCYCDPTLEGCGGYTTVSISNLKSGATVSCGCKRAKDRVKHGLRYKKAYRVWQGIKNRCLNPKNPSYKNYGARGIKICNEWLSPKPFCEWYETQMKEKEEELAGAIIEVDRINNDGNYEPENCRLVSNLINARNKRNNRYFMYNGCRTNLSELVELYAHPSLSSGHVIQRINLLGWSIEDALRIPKQDMSKRTSKGQFIKTDLTEFEVIR